MQFLYPQLAWGFLLLGVPVLIHLINMLRHRRRQWAAMDFLLASHKKNRRWVALRQWLLLAARILAMLLLVLMLAKWVSSSQWLSALGGQTTHHYVLLDDSYSMGEKSDDRTAYSRALAALGGLVRNISSRAGSHQITLVRYSRGWLAANAGEQARLDAAAELNGQSVTGQPARLLDQINASAPTALSVGPSQCIDLISPMIADNADQTPRVYFLTDMRRNELGQPEALNNQLQALSDQVAEVTFIDCGGPSKQNLSVVSLRPEKDIWAAGVPLIVRFQIRNQSTTSARNVVCKVRRISYPDGVVKPDASRRVSGDVVDLPPVVIEQIDAGETVTRQIEVVFTSPGSNAVEIALGEDAVATDNRSWCVIDVDQSQRVLVVDGDAAGRNAFFFETAVNPARRIETGIQVEATDASYLRDVSPVVLQQYDVIALIDLPRLDDSAVANIESFVSSGRGLLIAGGPNTNVKNLNEQMYRGGEGVFPAEIKNIELFSGGGETPDVNATNHPILEPLTRLARSPFAGLRISQLLRVEDETLAARDAQIVATGPDGLPLLVDMPFGDGRVLSLLTGIGGSWSNWTQDPTFVVLALRSLGYLSSVSREETSLPVGTPLQFVTTDPQVLPDGELLLPGDSSAGRLRLHTKVEQLDSPDGAQPISTVSLAAELGQTDRAVIEGLLRNGLYECWMTDAGGIARVRNRAHNVSATEGNLARVSRSEVAQKFPGLPIEVSTAAEIEGQGLSAADASQSTLLMLLLAALLMGEQVLAYLASYHSPTRAGGSQ
ncbi:MAG: BatA domain-containing protein [Aureliella sp.]